MGIKGSNKKSNQIDQRAYSSESDQEDDRSSRYLPGDPLVVTRNNHNLSRKLIDQDALKVMYRLINSGYQGFLVGGAVRDLLIGKKPKDFDIGTDARPEDVRRLFRNCRIIGRRFRLAHVYFFGNKIMEVSTFRSSVEQDDEMLATNVIRDDNTYGDPESDARRRDLTINGLFYDLSTFSVIDYVGGLEDLNNRVVRIIGEPDLRFAEDPVRMIRAVRHAARTGFTIEDNTYQSICRCAERLEIVPKSRVFEEFIREMKHGYAFESFRLMFETGLLGYVAPLVHTALESNPQNAWPKLETALKQMDRLANAGKDLLPSVLFPALIIGVVPPEELGATSEVVGGISLQELWASSPFEGFYGHDFQVPTKLPKIEFKKFLHFLRGGHVRHYVNKLFHPWGVSKRECERMEQLLIARLCMFESYYGITKVTGLEARPYFEDALNLMRLTVKDEYGQNCLEFWEERLPSSRKAQRNRTEKQQQEFDQERPRQRPRRYPDRRRKGE